ncbi:MAG TPA: signal peptide peptidase SppA [Syntrophomonadaceae bacterium]|nr:signal peptide peptidase SppA [Syntrophomonadaceae bacterium]HPR93444.1 signal peptide peptidase SppA [Syntrophomonadaceae bacterium]
MGKKFFVLLIAAIVLLVAGMSLGKIISPAPATLAGNSTIGVIEVNGVIAGDASSALLTGTTGASSRQIMESIRLAAAREDIKAVVLRINSPGGTTAASQEIAIELDKLRETGKPIVTSMSDTCASGGYWIACSTNYLVANAGTLTGSIGVIMELTNLQGLYEKIGVDSITFKSGEFKDMGSSSRPVTEAERVLFNDMIEDNYDQFFAQVLNGRQGKISEEKLKEIADGRVLTGQQALELGLVDSLGNYYDAIEIAEEMAGLPAGTNTEVINSQNFFDRFMLQVKAPELIESLELMQIK